MTPRPPLSARALFLACAMLAPAAAQKTIFVDAAAGSGGNGQSWGTAYNDLATALGTAASGDEVWVARGTYATNGKTFALPGGVGLYGGFVGGESRKDQRVLGLFQTTLDGGGKDRVVDVASSAPATTVLDGLTIANGFAKDGGGVYTYGGSPTVNQVVFRKNTVTDSPTARFPSASGGGFYTYQGAPKLTDCLFEENTALTNGGGFYTYQGKAELLRCRFVKNRAFDNVSTLSADVNGGGCYTYSGPVRLTDCSFDGNSVAYGSTATFGSADGGGFYSYEGDFVLEGVTFTDNTAQTGGGGVWSYEGTRTLTGCRFSGNRAENGAGMWTYTELANVYGCEFRGNVAGKGGGGIYNYQCIHVLASCLFAGNQVTTGSGGGVYTARDATNPAGTLTAVGCTFADNSATSGGGLYVGNGAPVVGGSILWNNTGGEIAGAPVVTYSIVKGGYTGTGNTAGDPLFRAAAAGDYELKGGSPAIDAGDNTVLPTAAIADALGNPRFLDDPKTQDSGKGTAPISDRGAFEYHGVEAAGGTREDFVLWCGVNAPPRRGTLKSCKANDTIHVLVDSPAGTFDSAFFWLFAEAFATNTPPVPLPFLPGIAVGGPGALFVPVGSLPASGFAQSLVVPSSAPGVSVLLQAGAISTKAKNSAYAMSNAVEFRF